MGVKILTDNIFTTGCDVIVNPVNCVGVMGAGLALEFRLRYPEMHSKYVELCEQKKLDIGLLWLYKGEDKTILNFPTKKHWKFPSKEEYLHAGLSKFVDTYKEKNISSIAFPMLGADRGGIDPRVSLEIMKSYLDKLDIKVEIYKYDPTAEDDLFGSVKTWLKSRSVDEIAAATGLRKNYINKVLEAMDDPEIHQLNQLGRVPGIGIKTLEKVFSVATGVTDATAEEASLAPGSLSLDL